MTDPKGPAPTPWSASPTAKTKNAVQRCVTALLDELAPERVLKRVERLPGAVEQHRTPSGCVLQAPTAAVSVSWFADATNDAVLGELHVIGWRGTVTRRGSPRTRKTATIAAELILRPVEQSGDECLWQTTTGARYDTASLSAKCLAILEEQLAAGEAEPTPDSSQP